MNSITKKKTAILLPYIILFILVSFLYIINLDPIILAYETIQGGFFVVLIICLRMAVLIFMSSIMFNRWLKAEKQFYSDIPFLFGIFFTILVFGKALDMLYNLMYFTASPETFTLIYKIRYIVAILTLIPLYALSLEVILYILASYKDKERLNSRKYRNKLKYIILSIIIVIELLAIILFLDVNSSRYILPAIVIPSILIMAIIFAFTYKNKLLNQVHSLLLCVAFFLYLGSQLLRPLAQTMLGLTASYIFLSELVDLVIFILIFIGLLITPKYI